MRGDARVERTRSSASRRLEAELLHQRWREQSFASSVFFEDLSCAKFRKSSQFFGAREKIVSDFLTERRTEEEKKKRGRERERRWPTVAAWSLESSEETCAKAARSASGAEGCLSRAEPLTREPIHCSKFL